MSAEPSPAETRPSAELEPRRVPGLSGVAYVPRLVVGALGDLRAIAAATRVLPAIAAGTRELPAIARALSSIEVRVGSLDNEVVEMRRAVESIRSEMDELSGEVRGAIHPLSRAAARVRRRGVSPPP